MESVESMNQRGTRVDGDQPSPLGLQTTEAYVVVRHLPESQGGKWVAFLGLGKAQIPVANPTAEPRRRGGKGMKRSDTRGTRSFDTELDATCAAWAEWMGRALEAIKRRGPGEAFPPLLPLPHFIIIEQDDHRSGWDVVTQGKPVAGLEPTGEVRLHHG